MKKIISLLLAVMLVVSVLSVSAVVAGASDSEDIAPVAANSVKVVIDGKTYETTKGAEFEYSYYLYTGGKVGSLDFETTYSAGGLKLVPFVDDYGDIDDSQFFPNLKSGSLVTNFDQIGHIKFNYSNTKGLRFDAQPAMSEKNLLITAKFTVTAASGSFEIKTSPVTIADENENKLCFKGEKLGSYETAADADGISSSTDPTTAPKPTVAPGSGKVVVIADGEQHELKKGDEFEYFFYLNTGGKVGSLDATTYFDTKGLKLIPYLNEDSDYDDTKHFPNMTTGSLQSNFTKSGSIIFNYSNTKGLRFNASPLKSDKNVVITAKFAVTADEGTFEINTIPLVIADENDTKLCYRGEKIGSYETGSSTTAPSVTPTATPTPTKAPVTEPAEKPTESPVIPSTKATIIADGVSYQLAKDSIFTYTYYLYTGGKVGSLDALTTYDTKGVQLVPFLDEDNDPDDTQYFPNLRTGSLVTNHNVSGQIKFNFTHTKGVRFNAQPVKSDKNLVITAQFKITASSGTYEIKTSPVTIADENDNKLCFKGEKIGTYDTAAELKDIAAPAEPTEKPTQKPTQAPTQKPTQKPTQAPTQKPTQAPTQKPTQAPTQKPTQAPTQKPTQAPTQKPTTAPVAEGLYVIADGKAYEMKKGETFTYTFYLNTGGKVGSLDATTFFDSTGLKLDPFVDEYGDIDDTQFFPNLTSGSLVTNFKNNDRILFNVSSTKGIRFSATPLESAKNVVITAKFTVTASKGRFEINTIPTLIADENENKLCFNTEKIGDYSTASSTGKKEAQIPTESGKTYMLGDVDSDGKVKILDSTCLQRKLASYSVTSYDAVAADVDSSGKVNILDATYIQRFLASIKTPYPIGQYVSK